MTGQRFGRLVVVERAPNRKKAVWWLCQCDCGNTREVARHQLRHARRPTRSCGCLYDERLIDRNSDVPACQRPTAKHPNGRTGTRAGWSAHHTAGQEPCGPCLDGHRRAINDGRNVEKILWRKYRLTLERYDQILAEQGGGCAICGSDDPRDPSIQRFHVDHDHTCCPGRGNTCGQCIRGLLCRACNTALGNFADDPARLRRAVDYLDQWPGSRPALGLPPELAGTRLDTRRREWRRSSRPQTVDDPADSP